MTNELANQTDAINARFNSRINGGIHVHELINEFKRIGIPWSLPFSGDELARVKKGK